MPAENQPPQEPVSVADQLNDLRELELSNYREPVKKARNALFIAGGLFFLGEMIGMFTGGGYFDPLVFVIALVEAGLFVGLGFWTAKKPYTAIVTGLVLFIILVLLGVIANGYIDGAEGAGRALVSGIIVKVFIVINLVRPLKDAKALQEAMRSGSL